MISIVNGGNGFHEAVYSDVLLVIKAASKEGAEMLDVASNTKKKSFGLPSTS